MRLNQLEMSGFKSFARSMTLEFPETLTAVVGPNGSGKSNIVDAFRWVLGEQSPSMLRCGRMEEIIFSGTASRRRLNLAQVTATFENDGSHDHLPTEIEVTRRLDRDGRSDYLLNGSRCRLRDIQELFWDTGLGKGSYAVIGQGEVERIVDASGDDLRTYVEEVAGVTRFRVILKESGDRANRGRDRYRRASDVLSVREEYVTPLREQAKRARLHRILSTHEMRLRRSVLATEYRNLSKSLEKNRTKFARAKQELNDISQRRRELALRSEELTTNLRYWVAREELFNEGTGRLERAEARLGGEFSVLEERLRTTESNLAAARCELEDLSRRREELGTYEGEDLAARIRERDRLQNEIAELRESAAGPGGSDEAEEVLRRAIRREEWFRGRIREAGREMEALDERLREAYTRAARATKRLEVLRSSASDTSPRETESESLETRPPEDVANDLAAATSQLSAGRNGLRELRERRDELRQRIAAWESRRQALEQVVENRKPQKRGADRPQHPPGELLLTHFVVPEDLRAAVPAALGTWATARTLPFDHIPEEGVSPGASLVLTDLGRARSTTHPRVERPAWTEWLLENDFGEMVAGWLEDLVECAEDLPRFRDLRAALFSNFLVVEDRRVLIDLLEAMWASESLPGGEYPLLVSMDGCFADPRGRISGAGSGSNAATEPVALAKEIRSLRSGIAEARRELEELERLMGTADDETKEWDERVVALKAERDLALRLREEAARRDSAVRREGERRQNEMDELEQSRTDASRSARDLERTKAELDRRRRHLIRALGALALFRSEREGQVAAARRDRESLAAAVETRRNQMLALSEEVAAIRARVEHWQSETERLQRRREDLVARVEECRGRRDRICSERTRMRERLDGYRRAVERASRGRAEATERRKRTAEEAENTRVAAARLEEKRAAVSNQLTSLESGGRRMREDRERVVASARREHNLDPPGLETITPATKIAEARRAISDLEGRRRSLEPINPLAVEEYRREVGDLHILESRVTDLKAALEGLESLRASLATRVEDRFLATLERVSGAFSETFVELFGGGEGHIRLKGDGKSSYPRLEIRAQPPGKKLSRMSLLSGGERALTGIVFLFSLLKVRPAPVCLLDEIDAALDDRNTDRLARYLRDSNGGIQYILITHQKRTMEVADALHGVTMAEAGISELVSVRLEARESSRRAAGPDDD